jgi:uncharacterized coiled-coil protein SlyX
MDQRLTELEIRYTHQASLLEELSCVLYEQQRVIQKLEARVTELERRAREEPEGGLGPVPNEPPPHY